MGERCCLEKRAPSPRMVRTRPESSESTTHARQQSQHTWTEGASSGIESVDSTGLPALLGAASVEPLSDAASDPPRASCLYLLTTPVSSACCSEERCLSSSSSSDMWWFSPCSPGPPPSPSPCPAGGKSVMSAVSSPTTSSSTLASSSLSSGDALIETDPGLAWLQERSRIQR